MPRESKRNRPLSVFKHCALFTPKQARRSVPEAKREANRRVQGSAFASAKVMPLSQPASFEYQQHHHTEGISQRAQEREIASYPREHLPWFDSPLPILSFVTRQTRPNAWRFASSFSCNGRALTYQSCVIITTHLYLHHHHHLYGHMYYPEMTARSYVTRSEISRCAGEKNQTPKKNTKTLILDDNN